MAKRHAPHIPTPPNILQIGITATPVDST
jgi:hypothetical protein